MLALFKLQHQHCSAPKHAQANAWVNTYHAKVSKKQSRDGRTRKFYCLPHKINYVKARKRLNSNDQMSEFRLYVLKSII